ncbi:MAG: DUF2764 family protein [Chlamydiales bacterium]
MTEYYFLASLLPPLEIGHRPELGFSDLKELLSMNLTQEDQGQVHRFLRLIDIENFRSYWAGETLDPRGNLNQEEIERALVNMQWSFEEDFPYFLQDYLTKYHTNEEKLRYFSFLLSQFFELNIKNEVGFLKEYYLFLKDLSLVIVGFRAKILGRNLAFELQYEDISNPIVSEILAQKDAKTYEPPFDYKELKSIFDNNKNSPESLHKMLMEYQCNKIIEFWGGAVFNLDRILNYMARLILVERWLELDVQNGIEIIDTIEREIE